MAKFWWRSLVATWPRQSNFCTRRDVPQSDAHATVRVAFVLSTATSRCFSAEFSSWRAACEIAHNRAEPAAAHFGTEECDTPTPIPYVPYVRDSCRKSRSRFAYIHSFMHRIVWGCRRQSSVATSQAKVTDIENLLVYRSISIEKSATLSVFLSIAGDRRYYRLLIACIRGRIYIGTSKLGMCPHNQWPPRISFCSDSFTSKIYFTDLSRRLFITSTKEVVFSLCLFVCLFVHMLAGFCKTPDHVTLGLGWDYGWHTLLLFLGFYMHSLLAVDSFQLSYATKLTHLLVDLNVLVMLVM